MTGRRVRLMRVRFPVRARDRSVVGVDARDAVFVRLEHDGRTGFGECAPLGATGEGSLEGCLRALEAWAAAGAAPDEIASMPAAARLAASAAMETLAGFGASPCDPIASAAYFGAGPDALDGAAIERLRRGAAVKVKVGRASAPDERRMLERILRDLPATRLRLDGNRSMGLEACVELVHGLPAERFEYLEEPLADPADLGRLHRRTGIAIALDELVADRSAEARTLRGRLADDAGTCAWVVRLSRLGTIDEVRRVAHEAAECGCDPVLSTAYESSWSIRLAVHLADALGARRRPHGLGTADVLEVDACVPASLEGGLLPGEALPVPLEGRW